MSASVSTGCSVHVRLDDSSAAALNALTQHLDSLDMEAP
jgi:hypothetical protein